MFSHVRCGVEIRVKIHCPDCQHMVPAADINIQTSLARCLNCDSVFNIQAQMGAVEAHQEEVGLPKGICAEVAGGALVIERRWFQPKHIFIGFFAGIWNLFLVFWYRWRRALMVPVTCSR